MKISLFLALLPLCGTSCIAQESTAPPPQTAPIAAPAPMTVGTARVAKWQGDKKAAFVLMFDDGWPSHWQVAVPELVKRNMTATFYIVPQKGEFKKFEGEWKKVAAQGMALGNHTFTHDGFQGLEDAQKEIDACTQFLLDFVPGKNPRLISFALPGVKDYNYGEGNSLRAMLQKNNLVDRGDFKGHGAVYHLQKTEQMLALADKAIAGDGMEYLVIHGVERITPNWGYQDFWALKQDVFLPLLDGLAERRDRGDLWITDHISQHKYATERDSATIKTLENTPKRIKLSLQTGADPAFYDAPLTVALRVPPTWKNCQIEQGATKTSVAPSDGVLKFDALPGSDAIVVSPLR